MQNYETCQIFTPDKVANLMMKLATKNIDFSKTRFLENSFGEGVFLIKIVEYIIDNANAKGMDNNMIANILENNVFGYEIDKELYFGTINKLNDIIEKNNIRNIKWKLYMEDSLKHDSDMKYDLIIGNPPYIKYSGLSSDNREYIKEKYEGCKIGRPDYYYAFIEDSLMRLSPVGKLVYLVPTGLFKNTHANVLRNLIKPHLTDIYDYKNNRLFPREISSKTFRNVTSTIIALDVKTNNNKINYYDMSISKPVKKTISKETLKDLWKFEEPIKRDNVFGDRYNIQISIATQLNKAFVLTEYIENKNTYYVDNIEIEKQFIYPASKPNSLRLSKEERIIFPYLVSENGKVDSIDNIDIYPGLKAYLTKFKSDLMNRKSDDKAKWYEYGRSQGIHNILGRDKLLLSTILTHQANIYYLNETDIPYSGIFITSKSEEYSLLDAKEILESKEFYSYAKKVGILVAGNSIRIKVQDIKNYTF